MSLGTLEGKVDVRRIWVSDETSLFINYSTVVVANPDNKILCWCQTKKIGTVWSKLTKEKRREYVSVSLAQIFLKACNNVNNNSCRKSRNLWVFTKKGSLTLQTILAAYIIQHNQCQWANKSRWSKFLLNKCQRINTILQG